VPYIRVGDMDWGNLYFDKMVYISEETHQNNLKSELFPGDILIAKTGATLGKCCIVPEAIKVANTTSSVGKVSINRKVTFPKWILFNFLHPGFQKNLWSYSNRTAQPGFNNRDIKVFKVKLTSLPEQRAIISKLEELFSDLEKGVADLKKAQDQLKIYRQAILKKAFEGELTREWREQQTELPTAVELLEQIKIGRQEFFEKQIEEWEFELKRWKQEGENAKKPKKPRPLTIPDAPNAGHEERKWNIPENWIWAQIGDLCFVTKLAGFEYTEYVKYVEDGDLPVLKAENAGPNGFKKTDYSKVKSKSVQMLTRSQLFGGELLVVFVGAGTGNVAMVPVNQRYFLGPNIGMARPYFNLDSKFIEIFLQSAFGKNLMMSAVKAVAQPSLSMRTIRQAPIAFPSFEEQHQIVQEIESRLSVCDKLEESISKSLEKAKSLRQSILKKAFEGTLLSEEEIAAFKAAPDYETASVLLEKIKKEKKKKP
jgi:type I restriction enzyme S subunit